MNWVASIFHRLTSSPGVFVVIALVATLGLWCMLPSSGKRKRVFGAILCIIAALLVITRIPQTADATTITFWGPAGITLASAIAAVTARNPVYCAIWFAVTLLGTGGLFLINGAQFLGVATVAVYAGAIVVTFLFVLMLAQPEGDAFYDRISWGGFASFLSILAAMTLTASMIWLIVQIPDGTGPTTEMAGSNSTLTEHHVAALGATLFSRHLIAVQASAALLMAALVGAVAIASRGADLTRDSEPAYLLADGPLNGERRD